MAAATAATPETTSAANGQPSFTAPVAVTTIDESQYAQQLQTKLAKLRELFVEFDPPEVEVFESPPSHFRMRAEFTVEQRDGELYYVMFDHNKDDHTENGGESGNGVPPDVGQAGPEADLQQQQQEEEAGVSRRAVGEAGEEAASTSAPAAAAAAAAGARKQQAAAGKKRPRGPRRVRVESFPVASRQVNELMEAVRREASNNPELRERLFQVNFHTTLAGDAMVTLLYHRKLGPPWRAAAEALRAALAATPTAAGAGRTPHVIGRSRKQKLELDAAHVEEVLRVGGRAYVQRQVEGAFSQPNGAVCQAMLGWALDVTRPAAAAAAAAAPSAPPTAPAAEAAESGKEAEAAEAEPSAVERAAAAVSPEADANGDLLELYCGNGNFTVPLAQNFRLVVATEVAKSSVEAARHNLAANGVANVFLARMASEEFAETMRARGSRRRLAGLGRWEELRLRTVLVDPPRAGLDDFTVQLLKEFDRIVYISCNPETLHANLRQLAPSHRIARFAAFDQFPYTHHLEAGVYLVRR